VTIAFNVGDSSTETGKRKEVKTRNIRLAKDFYTPLPIRQQPRYSGPMQLIVISVNNPLPTGYKSQLTT
jgi:hypothetical protein